MYLTETQVKTLLLIGDRLQIKHVGLNLLVARWKELYKNNPTTETLSRCHLELNSFIHKYEILLAYDLTQINCLEEK